MRLVLLSALVVLPVFVHAQSKVTSPVKSQLIGAHVEVKEMASDYVRTHAHLMTKKVRSNAEQTFIDGFKQGYSDVGDTDSLSANSADPFEAGYKTGAEYWKKFPDKRDYILAGFGYSKISTNGKWQLGFETSLFTMPSGMSCWLSPMNDALEGVNAKGGSVQIETVMVDVQGYLSQEGSYGHLGMARCEIIATSVKPSSKPH